MSINGGGESVVKRIARMMRRGEALAHAFENTAPKNKDQRRFLERQYRETIKDPFAREALLRDEIELFGREEFPHPDLFLNLYRAGRADKQKGDFPTIPLFVDGPAQFEEGQALDMPRFRKTPTMLVSLERQGVVAAEERHEPALRAMKRQWARVRQRLRLDFEREQVSDPREMAWFSALFLDSACVFPAGKARRTFIPAGEPGLFGLRGRKDDRYCSFRFSDDECFFISMKDAVAHPLVLKMAQCAKNRRLFWSARSEPFGAARLIAEHLERYSASVVTPEQFLAGSEGCTAVCKDVRLPSGETIRTELLLERLSREWGSAWRMLLCNRAAASVLFEDKLECAWQTRPLPDFLQRLLRGG